MFDLSTKLGSYLPQSAKAQETYDPVPNSFLIEDDSSSLGFNEKSPVTPASAPSSRYVRTSFIALGTLFVAVAAFIAGYALQKPLHPDQLSWNDLNEAIHYEPRKFEPRFVGPPSEYQGVPSPALDAKWQDLSHLYNFAVDSGTIIKANKSKANVQWPGTSKYQVGLEAFHQLHCLNFVRMATELSYYKQHDPDMMAESDLETKKHKDHCIETLRQRLMCNPDLQIYTYHWTEDSELPWADLRTNHQCVSWERLNGWAQTHAHRSPVIRKPEGAETVTDFDRWYS